MKPSLVKYSEFYVTFCSLGTRTKQQNNNNNDNNDSRRREGREEGSGGGEKREGRGRRESSRVGTTHRQTRSNDPLGN